MPFDIATTLLAVTPVATEVSRVLWRELRDRLRAEGIEDIPDELNTTEDLARVEASLAEREDFSSEEEAALTIDALGAAYDDVSGLRAERMRQARLTFNAALGLAIVGALIIFIGAWLLLLRNAITAGALTTALGAIVEVVSALLFRLNNETNNRLDEVGKGLASIETSRVAMSLIEKIGDPQKRDDAIRETAQNLQSHTYG